MKWNNRGGGLDGLLDSSSALQKVSGMVFRFEGWSKVGCWGLCWMIFFRNWFWIRILSGGQLAFEGLS